MMRKTNTLPLLAGAAALALAAGAQADDGPSPAGEKVPAMERAFASTIVSTYPDGRQAQLWLSRDGSYTAEGRRHDRSSGVWQVRDGKLCLKQKKPFLPFASFCTALPQSDDKPWQGKAPTGETISIQLVKGAHGRAADKTAGQADGGKS